MSDDSHVSSTPTGTSRFATTHWSVVLAAGDSSAPQHREALSTLCQKYWFPLYAYLRRRGYDTHQAEDGTQAFFAQMLEKHYLRGVEPKPAKFRSFLLMALKRFMADQRRRANAVKRGSGKKVLSLNIVAAESQYAIEPAHNLSPEKLFEKSWALTVLEQTMVRLEAELASTGKQELFESLKVYLCGAKDSIPYRDVAIELNMTEAAVKAAVYRLRQLYRRMLRDEIAQTVSTHDQVDGEIQDLFTVLAD
ncbi:MAG: RNA polymerase sigma factor [Planctomycetota bacterium]|jgi:RNA polymerase sigma-70 factor (ECF subfamily)